MTDQTSELQIAEDLKNQHRIFSTGKNVRPTAAEYVKVIERTSLAEQRVRVLTEALAKYKEGNDEVYLADDDDVL
jgi:hypothetical protein